ncbi:MAG: helix-turn-helix transcriptional regulator [Clostridiaceae bacterium]
MIILDEYRKINAVQKMQKYIETNLNNNITLHELAQEANYSPWYSAKIFKELIGKSPFEYIRLLRLSGAAIELRDSEKKVVDVAMEFSFDSHEGFTRAFTKEFGIAPKKYKDNTPPICLFKYYPIKDKYLLNSDVNVKSYKAIKPSNFFVQVMYFPERKLIFKSGLEAEDYFKYTEEVGVEVWGILCSIKEALYEPVGLWLPDNFRKEGTSKYVQGVEVPKDYPGIVPEGFEIMTLPPCKMMIFQGEPFDDDDFQLYVCDLVKSIDNYDPKVYGYKWAEEDGPCFQMEPQGYRGYIEGRPVREL